MNVKGGSGLRGSIMGNIEGHNIAWRSSLPYAAIHNEGGEITVTPQMIKFFWAMCYKASNAMSGGNSQRNTKLSNKAAIWKALTLMKPGSKIKMPERRFVGAHPVVDGAVERVVDENVQAMNDVLHRELL